MTRRFLWTTIAALLLAGVEPLVAETVTVEASRDNTLFETRTGNLSNGTGPHLYVGCPLRFEAIRRGLLAFDLSAAIPVNAVVSSARLRLRLTRESDGNPAAQNVRLHRVLADWGEGNSNAGSPGGNGAPAQSGDATWLHTFFDQSFWHDAGGDFVASASAAASVGGEDVVTWGPSVAMTADVQSWVREAASNFGWILVGNENDLGSAKRFESRHATDATTRPRLEVEFEIPTASPTPTATAALPTASAPPSATATARPPTATPAACSGDCDGDGVVRVAELIRGVRIALGFLAAADCVDMDVNGDRTVGIGELIRAVNSALGNCVR
jgi:hypothetical protein